MNLMHLLTFVTVVDVTAITHLLTFISMFGCLGMAQQKDLTFKEKLNLVFTILLVHQRAIVVTTRNKWGSQALGSLTTMLALGLMLAWYVLSRDGLMLLWIGLWLLCLVKNRIQAVRLSNQISSDSDGYTINLGPNEKLAKLFLEPLGVGILAGMAFWFYQLNGWKTSGLPNFLLAGTVSLPLVAFTQYTIWQRRVQGTIDAKIQNEALAREFHNRIGG